MSTVTDGLFAIAKAIDALRESLGEVPAATPPGRRRGRRVPSPPVIAPSGRPELRFRLGTPGQLFDVIPRAASRPIKPPSGVAFICSTKEADGETFMLDGAAAVARYYERGLGSRSVWREVDRPESRSITLSQPGYVAFYVERAGAELTVRASGDGQVVAILHDVS